jgi:D-tyrosyl-tRNA(Tyr) deacylase
MRALLQRVLTARVVVDEQTVGEIDHGVLVFLAIEKNDTEQKIRRMAQRILNYRLFADEQHQMNLNVQQVKGGVLLVSQFTLAADTAKGNRPSFAPAADPVRAEKYYESFVSTMLLQYDKVSTGVFGADMKVHLVNDGPITFCLVV